jgi:peptide/nickel transport system permease protein
MARYLLRRVGFLVIALVVSSVLVFALIRFAGGSVAAVVLGKSASPEAVIELEAKYGLDRPLVVQYFDWIFKALQGDLGHSFRTNEAVSTMLVDRLPLSVPLGLSGLLLAILIAVPVGIIAARGRDHWSGTVVTVITQIGIAVPVFWAGVLLARLFGADLGWLPTGGWTSWSDPLGAVRSLILPVLTLSLLMAAALSRFMRTALLDVLDEDYMRTARAYGMTRNRALLTVGLHNGSLPMITVVGLLLVELVGSTVVVETVFSLPGLSRMILANVQARELLVVQSSVMVIVAFVLVVNLLIDVAYGFADPRVRVAK